MSQEGDEANECSQPALLEQCADSDGSSFTSERSFLLDPVWVQCSHPTCQKWRLLPDTFDATEVVDDWVCDMNSDEKHNKCEDNEETYSDDSDDENFGFIYSPFTNGSVVWAAIDSYSAWWPAMIVPDPEENMTLQTVSSQCATVESYHVVFFGKKPTRAWIPAHRVKAYGKFDPKTDPVRDALVARTLAQWNNSAMKEAREKAQEAFAVKDIQSRLRVFGHMSYFKRLMRRNDQHQLSQQPPSPVRKSKPLSKFSTSQPASTKPIKYRKKAVKENKDDDRLANRKRLINETIGEVASGAGVLMFDDSTVISASVTAVVEAVANRVANSVKKAKLAAIAAEDTPTAKKFRAPVAMAEKNPTAAKKPRTKKFNAPTTATSEVTPTSTKKPRTKKPKASVSAADVSPNTTTEQKQSVISDEPFEQLPQTLQQESASEPCVSEGMALMTATMISPSEPTTTESLASELVSLSQQLRQPSANMDVSQESLLPPRGQLTPMKRVSLSAVHHASQEDERDQRTLVLCEAAAERLNSFLNLSQELLNASMDVGESERARPSSLQQVESNDAPAPSLVSSLSQQLRRPPAELNMSQEWLSGVSGRSQPSTPLRTPRTPLATLVNKRLNSSQDVGDETDKRTKAVCEKAAKRLDNFLSLSQEALNTTIDDSDGENTRPLSQTPIDARRDKTPRKTFAPTFKPLFAKINR